MGRVAERRRKNDIQDVGDGLQLRCARPFSIVRSDHRSVEAAENRPIPNDGALCLLFVAQGHVEIGVGCTRHSLRPADACLLQPARHDLLSVSHGPDAEYYLVQFRRAPQPAGVEKHVIDVPEHVATRNPGRLTHLLRIFMEETRRSAPSRLVLHHLVVLMLCEMASSSHVATGTAVREVGPESLASRVDAFIAAHYHTPIRTPEIADALRYNPDYLERAYHAERGISIREAIHERRIREARAQLILQSASAIGEVAALCGFSDPANFRRVFKRATNMTPRGFRLCGVRPAMAGVSTPAGSPLPAGSPAGIR